MIDYGKSDALAPVAHGKHHTAIYVLERDCLEVGSATCRTNTWTCTHLWDALTFRYEHCAIRSHNTGTQRQQRQTECTHAHKHTLSGLCAQVAQELSSRQMRPLVLNMTSDRWPGGDWRSGAAPLEENFFRRSTYCLTMEEEFNKDKKRKWRCVECLVTDHTHIHTTTHLHK